MHSALSTQHSSHAFVHLDIADLALDYGTRRVLPSITVALEHGDTLVVAGPNGSGKSSLLRIICGLQRPTHGSIQLFWRGIPITAHQLPHYVGWVAPDLHLYRDLTALENLQFFVQVRGLQQSQAELEALLHTVGLAGRGGDMLRTYSSGMTQRLRYAYALLHKPPVLLLDEPTVTLDEHGAALVEQLVLKQREQGITIIATNDPRELRFGSYILRLEGGDQ